MMDPDVRLPDGWDDIPDPAAILGARPLPLASPPAEPSLTRASRQRRALVCAILSLAWIGAPIAALHPRGDIDRLGVIAAIAFWTLTLALALVLALRPRRRGLPAGVRAIQLVILGVSAAFVLGCLVVSAGIPEVVVDLTQVRGGLGCLTITSIMGIGPLLLAASVLRRSFPSAPALRGAAVGVIAGLGGAIGIYALCPVQARMHLLISHGLPILALTLAGAALGAIGGRP